MSKRKINEQSFFDACYKGNLEKVKELLANGVDPLCKNEDGWNGLTYASFNGHIDIFKTVEIAAAEKERSYQRQRDVFRAMEYAIKNGHSNIVDYVLEQSKTKSTEQFLFDDVLHQAARYGKLDMAKQFIARGADIHDQAELALRVAAENGHTETVKHFIELGSDVNACDSTALIQSARNGHTETVDLLLKHGAKVHAENDDALVYSAINGHADIVRILLENGADINAQERGAVLYAARNGHNDVLDIYIEKGIDVFDQGACPIAEAVYNGHLSVAQNLIITHNIAVTEKTIEQLHEEKDTARLHRKNTSIFDETFLLIEKQQLNRKLKNNLVLTMQPTAQQLSQQQQTEQKKEKKVVMKI